MKIIKLIKQITIDFGSRFIVFSLVFVFFNFSVLAASETKTDQLIERISKDFTKKFCNGVGFGLSKESAMNFAIKENEMAFQKKVKNIDILDNELIANKISLLVVDKCGYPLDLRSDEDIDQFAKDYLKLKLSN